MLRNLFFTVSVLFPIYRVRKTFFSIKGNKLPHQQNKTQPCPHGESHTRLMKWTGPRRKDRDTETPNEWYGRRRSATAQLRLRVTRPVLRDHFPPATRQRPIKMFAPLSFVRLFVCSYQFSPKLPISCSVNRSSAGHGDAESILGMRGRRMQ